MPTCEMNWPEKKRRKLRLSNDRNIPPVVGGTARWGAVIASSTVAAERDDPKTDSDRLRQRQDENSPRAPLKVANCCARRQYLRRRRGVAATPPAGVTN